MSVRGVLLGVWCRVGDEGILLPVMCRGWAFTHSSGFIGLLNDLRRTGS